MVLSLSISKRETIHLLYLRKEQRSVESQRIAGADISDVEGEFAPLVGAFLSTFGFAGQHKIEHPLFGRPRDDVFDEVLRLKRGESGKKQEKCGQKRSFHRNGIGLMG